MKPSTPTGLFLMVAMLCLGVGKAFGSYILLNYNTDNSPQSQTAFFEATGKEPRPGPLFEVLFFTAIDKIGDPANAKKAIFPAYSAAIYTTDGKYIAIAYGNEIQKARATIIEFRSADDFSVKATYSIPNFFIRPVMTRDGPLKASFICTLDGDKIALIGTDLTVPASPDHSIPITPLLAVIGAQAKPVVTPVAALAGRDFHFSSLDARDNSALLTIGTGDLFTGSRSLWNYVAYDFTKMSAQVIDIGKDDHSKPDAIFTEGVPLFDGKVVRLLTSTKNGIAFVNAGMGNFATLLELSRQAFNLKPGEKIAARPPSYNVSKEQATVIVDYYASFEPGLKPYKSAVAKINLQTGAVEGLSETYDKIDSISVAIKLKPTDSGAILALVSQDGKTQLVGLSGVNLKPMFNYILNETYPYGVEGAN